MGPQCPIAFCDIVGKEGEASSHHKAHQESKCNRIEADKIVINRLYVYGYIASYYQYFFMQVDIIVALRKTKRSNNNKIKIAVLTPYKAQKEVVKELVEKKKLDVTVSTINESQGIAIAI